VSSEDTHRPDGGEPLSEARKLLDSLTEGLERVADPADEDTSRQERSLERLLEIAHAMNRIHERDQLFESVSRWLRELFDAENSFVVLLDEEGRLEVRTAHMSEPGTECFPVSETILQRPIEARRPIAIDDTSEIPEFSGRSSIERLHIRSVLCAPLIVGERVLGVLQFDHRATSTRFPERDRRLLQLFADQAATAFHNLDLIEQLNDSVEEVRRAHGRLVRSERLSAVGEMATGMAHNFNNTLFIALGHCEVLLERRDLDPDVRASVVGIRRCALDAANTVRRLQEFARGERGGESGGARCVPSKVVAELVPVLKNKVREVEHARSVSLRLRTELEPTPQVAARASDLREVLINLVFNGLDAMDADGEVLLRSGVDRRRVFVQVRDEGRGMSGEVAARVFEPFFTTKGRRGAGLGVGRADPRERGHGQLLHHHQ